MRMPITDIQIRGSLAVLGSLDANDLQSLSSHKNLAKIQKTLAKTPVPIELWFVNTEEGYVKGHLKEHARIGRYKSFSELWLRWRLIKNTKRL